MLEENGRELSYREYTKQPLSEAEIRAVLAKLGMTAHEVLRSKDAKKLGIDPGAMDDDALIAAMAEHPRLLQRPIGVQGGTAVLGRPPERLLEL